MVRVPKMLIRLRLRLVLLAKAFTGIGGMINTATVAIIASLGVGMVAGTRAAIEFEDAFAMVKKTMADVEDPKVFEKIAR